MQPYMHVVCTTHRVLCTLVLLLVYSAYLRQIKCLPVFRIIGMNLQILQQFMQRCNSLGWLNRSHFEERWMQLLGVINQPLPVDGLNPEEYHAHTANVCTG